MSPTHTLAFFAARNRELQQAPLKPCSTYLEHDECPDHDAHCEGCKRGLEDCRCVGCDCVPCEAQSLAEYKRCCDEDGALPYWLEE